MKLLTLTVLFVLAPVGVRAASVGGDEPHRVHVQERTAEAATAAPRGPRT